MQNLDIDRKKSPEVDDYAADLQPGDKICLYATVKSVDDQTLGITITSIGDDKSDREDDEEDVGNEGSDAEVSTNPPGSLAALDDENAVP
jgi:hypothetical protein